MTSCDHLGALRPTKLVVGVGEAQSWASTLYGLEVLAEELPGEIDRNFLLTGPDGERWVLKVAPAGTANEVLDCQMAVLEFLERTAPEQPVPRLVRDQNGRCSSHVRTCRGEEGRVRLVSFLPGVPLARLEKRPPALDGEVGSLLGRLDTALLGFDHPGAHREFFWDVTRVVELRSYLEWMAPEVRPLVEFHLDRFARRVLPRLPQLPKSNIHNDANDYNLLVAADGDELRLTGIIDFGDMVFTVTVAEVAIASTYLMLGSQSPRETAARVLEGYTATKTLSDLEREVIPDLILGRLCNSLLMSAQAQRLSPENGYLTISERPSIDLLRSLTP